MYKDLTTEELHTLRETLYSAFLRSRYTYWAGNLYDQENGSHGKSMTNEIGHLASGIDISI